MHHPQTYDGASLRLAISLTIMLAFAGFEFVAGRLTGLTSITADGINMLSHSAYMGIALVVQVLLLLLPTNKRSLLESTGGLLVATFMFVMAFMVVTSQEHHGEIPANVICTAPQDQGLVMIFVGLLSLLVHAGVGRILYGGRERLLVHGACIYIFSHTLMAASMIASGALLSLFGWQSIDMWLSFGIAAFMALSGFRLMWLSLDKLL